MGGTCVTGLGGGGSLQSYSTDSGLSDATPASQPAGFATSHGYLPASVLYAHTLTSGGSALSSGGATSLMLAGVEDSAMTRGGSAGYVSHTLRRSGPGSRGGAPATAHAPAAALPAVLPGLHCDAGNAVAAAAAASAGATAAAASSSLLSSGTAAGRGETFARTLSLQPSEVSTFFLQPSASSSGLPLMAAQSLQSSAGFPSNPSSRAPPAGEREVDLRSAWTGRHFLSDDAEEDDTMGEGHGGGSDTPSTATSVAGSVHAPALPAPSAMSRGVAVTMPLAGEVPAAHSYPHHAPPPYPTYLTTFSSPHGGAASSSGAAHPVTTRSGSLRPLSS